MAELTPSLDFLRYIEAHQALDVSQLNLSQLELLSDLIDLARKEVDDALQSLKNTKL